MPTKTYWIEEPIIMAADYEGHVTIDDIDQLMHACTLVVDNHPCYFLVDALRMSSIQPGFFKIGSLLNFIRHPNLRWFAVVVGYNPVFKFAAQVLVRNNSKIFNDRDEALTFLRNRILLDNESKTTTTQISA